MAAHRPRLETDEYFCTVCHKRWGRDEDPPDTCADVPKVASRPKVHLDQKASAHPPSRRRPPRYAHY